jgi:hypothetical protein
MVQPLDPVPRGETDRSRYRGFGVAVTLILFAGVVFFVGRVGPPSDPSQAVPTTAATTTAPTTTTPRITEVIPRLGEPLEWQPSRDFGELFPIAIVDHEGILYLFGTPDAPRTREGGGAVLAWVSGDGGTTWESLGTVIPASRHSVQSVISTSQGLVAVGADRVDGGPRVWRSPDGVRWSATDLPAVGPGTPGWSTWVQAAGATDDLLVVFGSTVFDAQHLIVDSLPDHLRPGEDEFLYGMSWGGPPFRLTIYAPLGVPVFSADAAELGLTDAQVASLFPGPEMDGVTVWTSSDGGASWDVSEMEASHIDHLAATPDGDLIATGYGRAGGPGVWISADGLQWERQSLVASSAHGITPWDGGLIGVRDSVWGPDIVRSADGRAWESFGIHRLLEEGFSWYLDRIVVGPGGIATVAHGHDDRPTVRTELERLLLEKDGYRLTFDEGRWSLVLSAGETEVLRLSLDGDRVRDEVTADFRERTMSFFDPVTGEALVTFTFDELEGAQSAMWPTEPHEFRQVVLFSPDGKAWSVHDVSAGVGESGSVSALRVTADRVIAIITRHSAETTGTRRPAAPTMELWAGLIP